MPIATITWNNDSHIPESDFTKPKPAPIEIGIELISGEGHVSYTIKAKDDLVDGTEITNSAIIVFDINDPIVTNEVVNVIYTPQSDLVVISAGFESGYSTFVVSDTINLNTTVENQGLADVGEFHTKVFLGNPDAGGTLIDEVLIEALNSDYYS